MRVLGRRYRLVERIAAGGVGEVWRGDDLALGRAVAVKLLKHPYRDSAEFRIRFRHEARLSAAVSHPAVAQVYDYGDGEDDGQQPYLVLEYVVGESLADALARRGTLGVSPTLDVIAQAAAGLHAAHVMGLVHRDVKPANLLLRHDGVVKVTDFGIARSLDGAPLTHTGEVIGTPYYLAPERVRGASATPASDLYSLGVVAHECLTGCPPFVGQPLAVAAAHRDRPLPPLPDRVPPEVRELVCELAAKHPLMRPASAAEVSWWADDLRRRLVSGSARRPVS